VDGRAQLGRVDGVGREARVVGRGLRRAGVLGRRLRRRGRRRPRRPARLPARRPAADRVGREHADERRPVARPPRARLVRLRVVELPDRAAELHVAPRPPAGERRQVVRVDGGQRRRRVPARRPERPALLALEVQHLARQHAPARQRRRHVRRHRAQVLADDERAVAPARAAALEREHAEQRVGREAHVGAVAPAHPVGDPELAEEAERVVDAQRAGVRDGRAHQRRPVAVAALGEHARVPRRQPPVLPVGAERVGGRADGHAARVECRVAPHVGARRRRAHGEVLVQPDRQPARARRGGRGGQLRVELELAPAVEVDHPGVRARERGGRGPSGAWKGAGQSCHHHTSRARKCSSSAANVAKRSSAAPSRAA
jgi:hypothetical protein